MVDEKVTLNDRMLALIDNILDLYKATKIAQRSEKDSDRRVALCKVSEKCSKMLAVIEGVL